MIELDALNESRRAFLRAIACAAGGAVVAPQLLVAQSGDALAETMHGRVRGLTVDGIRCFRGIPYGADTGGKNRFLPPQKAAN